MVFISPWNGIYLSAIICQPFFNRLSVTAGWYHSCMSKINAVWCGHSGTYWEVVPVMSARLTAHVDIFKVTATLQYGTVIVSLRCVLA